MTGNPTEYDRVTYGGKPIWQAHPGHVAAIAWLHGLDSPPVSRCRVLELGTGNGANLIPMAYQFPQSEFVGIDLSARAIEQAQATAADVGLSNIQFQQLNIMDIGPETGLFDYIIAHGVYSWVPSEVRTKMLSVFRDNLAPSGVAYVSYNCQPWSFMRDLVRGIMLFHVREMNDPAERVAQARKLLQFVTEMSDGDQPYGMVLRSQLERIRQMPDWFLYHDDLLPDARAFFLHEVVMAAAEQGLQYLGEAKSSELNAATAQEKVQQTLRGIPGDQPALRDQYYDFISGCGFRASLFCHANVTLIHPPDVSRIKDLYFAGDLAPADPPLDLSQTGVARFKTKTADIVSTSHALSKAAFLELGSAWPRFFTFPELLEKSRIRLGAAADAVANDPAEIDTLIEVLFRAFSIRALRTWREPPPLTANVTIRPTASFLARKQAETETLVSALTHDAVRLHDDTKLLLPLVDGSRTVRELVESVLALSENTQQSATAEAVENNLAKFAKCGLLIA